MALRFFAVSLIIAQFELKVNLLDCPLLGRLGNSLECFQLANNLPDSKSFINGTITLPRLMGGNNYFSKIIDIFPHRHLNNTHLSAPDQQTVKTSAHTYQRSIIKEHLQYLNNSVNIIPERFSVIYCGCISTP